MDDLPPTGLPPGPGLKPLPAPDEAPTLAPGRSPTTAQLRRLRQLWRSAGWPCQDMLELELLASGWLERLRDGHGRETLRLTDAGIAVLHAGYQRNRGLRDRHETLVERMAVELQRAGRIVWRGLTLRAGLPQEDDPARMRWVNAMPDLYSLRHTTVEDYLEPAVHEIKVSRADLLGELRRPAKAQAYLALSSQCWYVLKAGIATPQEIPAPFGVLIAHEGLRDRSGRSGRSQDSDQSGQGAEAGDGFLEAPLHFELARPAPRRPMRPDFGTWMALARATCQPAPLDSGQDGLQESPCGPPLP